MTTEINICLATDNNYIHHTATAVASILYNADSKDKYHFYILATGLYSENKEKFNQLKKNKDCQIDYIDIDNELVSRFREMKIYKHINLSTYNRLFIPALFPQIQKMIYLDSDIVAIKDIAELNNFAIDNAYFAGVLDPSSDRLSKMLGYENDPYINAGVMIINCEQLRRHNYLDTIFNSIDKIKDKSKNGDQDLINYCFHEHLKIIPGQWNVFLPFIYQRCKIPEPTDNDYLLSKRDPVIIHFVGPDKPWNINCTHPYKEKYLKYLSMTPWAEKAETIIALTHISTVINQLSTVINQQSSCITTLKNKIVKLQETVMINQQNAEKKIRLGFVFDHIWHYRVQKWRFWLCKSLSFGKRRDKYRTKYKAVRDLVREAQIFYRDLWRN